MKQASSQKAIEKRPPDTSRTEECHANTLTISNHGTFASTHTGRGEVQEQSLCSFEANAAGAASDDTSKMRKGRVRQTFRQMHSLNSLEQSLP